jgi:formylmethanofuran dehydrogenase subunit E
MDKLDKEALWQQCIDFHGHVCGGLLIGFQAALYVRELLNINFSEDEDLVCVSENDACGVDAIQVLLGCSVGKGNLLFRLRGKQAFSFFDRQSRRSVRLVLREIKGLSREEKFEYMQSKQPSELFDIKQPSFVLPERARIFHSLSCASCGENFAENMGRIANGETLCLDCYQPYHRFDL